MQGGDAGLRSPTTVTQGGVFVVEVSGSSGTVEVTAGSPQSTWSFPVPPNKRVSIPVPPVPPGTVLMVRCGTGPRVVARFVEVVSPIP